MYQKIHFILICYTLTLKASLTAADTAYGRWHISEISLIGQLIVDL